MKSPDLSLYLVTDSGQARAAGHDLVDVVRAACENGVTTVQIREKDAPARAFLDTVRRVAEVIPEHVSLLVNDRVDVHLAAVAAGIRSDGVHVGQNDLPVELVRELIGPDAVLGLSAATPEELAAAAASSARVDYVGIGALHSTATKKDAPDPLGHERFAELVRASELPAVGIGGVKAEDVPAIRRAGAAGAAVVSAICAVGDPAGAARELRTGRI